MNATLGEIFAYLIFQYNPKKSHKILMQLAKKTIIFYTVKENAKWKTLYIMVII
jgi:hypothetical protein